MDADLLIKSNLDIQSYNLVYLKSIFWTTLNSEYSIIKQH